MIACPTCARRAEETIEQLRAELANRTTALDVMREHADDAEWLLHRLALHLADFDPDFVDTLLDEDERAGWKVLAPLGRDDDDAQGNGGS